MSYTPKAPKPIIQRTYHEVQFVFGKDWKWTFPSVLNLGEIAKFKQVAYDHCVNYLITQLNAPMPSKEGSDLPDNSRKEKDAIDAISILLSKAKTDKIIPTDEQIESVSNRFSRSIVGFSEWNDNVIKEQLDTLCKPVGDAPSVSDVWNEEGCDREVIEDVLGFFWILVGWKTASPNDSTEEKKSSEETTIEASI